MDTASVFGENASGNKVLQYFTFYMGKEAYGVGVAHVKEVIEYHRVYPVPRVPEYIRGVINLRGDVLPVIDLSYLFFGKKCDISGGAGIMIIEVPYGNEMYTVGAIIDQVDAVMDIPEENMEPPPELGGKIRADYMSGVGKSGDRFIILLDIEKVLDIDELSRFESSGTS